jgi:hypothetical protein
LHPLAQLVHARALLGNEDGVRAGRHARVQRDPPDVAAHHLGHHAAIVRVTGGAQAVHRLRRDTDGGVEAERVVRRVEVVVDRLRHADDAHARVGEALGGGQGALPADRDERIQAVLGHDLVDAVDAASPLEGVRAARAEDRSALLRDALHLVTAERHRVVLDEPLPAVTEAHVLVLVNGGAGEDGSADDRVESGGVAARRQHSDTHSSI